MGFKNLQDIRERFSNELTRRNYRIIRTGNFTEPEFLYYKKSGKNGVDGGVLICAEKPKNEAWKLADSRKIPFSGEHYQIMNMYDSALRRLPVLDI